MTANRFRPFVIRLLTAAILCGSGAPLAAAPEEPPAISEVPAEAPSQPPPPAEGQPKRKSAARQLIDVAVSDGKIETAILQINSQLQGTKVSHFGKIAEQRVTVIAEQATVQEVLGQIANPKGWVWWEDDDGNFGIGDKEYYERVILVGQMIQKVFRPNNVKASELDRAVKGLLTPQLGSSVADDRTNKLIVNDLPPALERIERFIREIDVQLIVRVFYIRRAKVEDIAKKLEQYKSGPGTIELDVKTRQIIVTDLLANIKKMELLVDILDVGPEIVQYDINNIGIEGEDLEGLQKIIDSIRTSKELLFEVNAKQGVMILEDVPEVHERVEQILAEFDKPVRQVLLQSEIVSTGFTREFSFGLTQSAWADDLLGAFNQNALGSGFLGATGAAGGARFTDLGDIFPNVSQTGSTVTGNYMSQTVMLQYQAVYSNSSTRTLLQPRLLVKNQSKSTIFVGEEVPYLNTFFDDDNNSSSNRSTSQSTVQSGLKFEVTPSISNSFLVELELKIENDTAIPQDIEDRGEVVRVVGRDRQNVESVLQIPSGQTRVLGGLITNKDSDGNAGYPFLVDIPYIGSIFGLKSSNREASNLLIFITPTIVEDEMPRQLNKDGRRGRSLTNYERLPGEFDLDLDKSADSEQPGTGVPEGIPAALLSGDAAEEQEEIELFEKNRREQARQLEDSQAGNYVPSLGVGSTTLNTTGQSGSSGSQAPPPSQQPPVTTEAAVPVPQPPPPADGDTPQPGTIIRRNETIYQ
jgi:type II secretory pathway component GspD/PulD (secretin)